MTIAFLPGLELLDARRLLSGASGAAFLPVGSSIGSPWKTVTPDDFEARGLSDLAVYRPTTAQWIVRLVNGGTLVTQFGDPSQGDVAVPGDYEGNGKTDLAVFRPTTGQWITQLSGGFVSVQTFPGFEPGDLPVPADYERIGKTDLAVYRPSTGQWFILLSSGSIATYQMGNPTQGDIPVPADYQGVGLIDLAVFRPATDQWIIREPGGTTVVDQMGDPTQGDIPVPGDYEGIGKADLAVYRPSTGLWIIRESSGETVTAQFGDPAQGDVPAGPSQTDVIAPSVVNQHFLKYYSQADWTNLHDEFEANARAGDANVLFLGDSITYLWSNSTATPQNAAFRSKFDHIRGQAPWNSAFAPLSAVNYGIPGDNTGNLLWRILNGELAGRPKVAVVLIGLNDLSNGANSQETARGIVADLMALRSQSPASKILLLGIMPRGIKGGDPLGPEITTVNAIVSQWSATHGVSFSDFGSLLAGDIDSSGHPTAQGYQILAGALDVLLHSFLNS